MKLNIDDKNYTENASWCIGKNQSQEKVYVLSVSCQKPVWLVLFLQLTEIIDYLGWRGKIIKYKL